MHAHPHADSDTHPYTDRDIHSQADRDTHSYADPCVRERSSANLSLD